MGQRQDIYGNVNPRDVAAYTVAEAARYIRIPSTTLRAWVDGQDTKRHLFRTLISPSRRNPLRLSFNNVIEAYTLRDLRIKHRVSIAAAREAIDVAEKSFDTQRLLLCPELSTRAGDLFIEKFGELVNLNKAGQIAMKIRLHNNLKHIERDESKLPIRLYPAYAGNNAIVIDPRIAFGRPIIARRGISTAVIVDRINAGELADEIAEDYDLETAEVNDALIFDQAA